QFGTPDEELAFRIAADNSGVYVAGFTAGSFPGATNAGSNDAFVRKFDTDGNEVWTRQFGTSELDDAVGVAADDSGVYVSGQTWGTLANQTSAGFRDAYVRKYDTSGN